MDFQEIDRESLVRPFYNRMNPPVKALIVWRTILHLMLQTDDTNI